MPKKFKAFRFNPELYDDFKKLVSASGYTVVFCFCDVHGACTPP